MNAPESNERSFLLRLPPRLVVALDAILAGLAFAGTALLLFMIGERFESAFESRSPRAPDGYVVRQTLLVATLVGIVIGAHSSNLGARLAKSEARVRWLLPLGILAFLIELPLSCTTAMSGGTLLDNSFQRTGNPASWFARFVACCLILTPAIPCVVLLQTEHARAGRLTPLLRNAHWMMLGFVLLLIPSHLLLIALFPPPPPAPRSPPERFATAEEAARSHLPPSVEIVETSRFQCTLRPGDQVEMTEFLVMRNGKYTNRMRVIQRNGTWGVARSEGFPPRIDPPPSGRWWGPDSEDCSGDAP